MVEVIIAAVALVCFAAIAFTVGATLLVWVARLIGAIILVFFCAIAFWVGTTAFLWLAQVIITAIGV